jgi:hypothetical protein
VVKLPEEVNGSPVLAFAEVPERLKDEYEMTIVATGEVVVIAGYAIVRDNETDGFLAIEIDPTGRPLEDWWYESVDEAIAQYEELGLDTVILK